MPEIKAVFLDDGGVINDNNLRAPEWQRLVADFFTLLFGGDRNSWIEANKVVMGRLEQMLIDGPQGQNYIEWFDSYLLYWLSGMTTHVGVATPANDADCLKLAWQASDYITPRVRSGYPGAEDAIRAITSMGFKLFTASGEHSRELTGYLEGMGIRECFDCLYGADLVNTGKYSADYYRRIFEHAGVRPERTLVVDDKSHNLAWAASLGAVTCLISTSPDGASADFTTHSLADLVPFLQNLI